MTQENNFPKLHNAAWPGVVGKGVPGAEPCLDLDTMLDLTAAADVDGVRFDGFDLFLYSPHFNIDGTDDDIKILAEKAGNRGLTIGSVVAPIWGNTGGGSAFGETSEREKFLSQVKKGCHVAEFLRKTGIRPYGGVRLDSSGGVEDWCKNPVENQKTLAETLKQACHIAENYGETLVAEGEICWGGMHSWKNMLHLLEMTDRPDTLGFQADMSHTLLYLMGYNAPEDRLLPENFDWNDTDAFDAAYKTMTDALRPWTKDFHVAQNDGTVHGSGAHDKTGRHCLAKDPNGKLDIAKYAGFWLRDEQGNLTKKIPHLCWDGCMFSNETMKNPQTWNDILAAMIAVRKAHGWTA
ncbi:MAG: TIM barrel protein [Planctomycetaceae bacterium]|jgi:sugar phosphate isomerase/epimerase|nr:TIM barrel protein [Planctomycetaceae bacterium]